MSDINWTALGTGLATAFIAFMTAYNAWKARQTAKVVETIHTLTNSNMGAQKKTLAEVSAAKFAITKDPVDGQASELAMKDWLEHVGKQAVVDAKA